MTTTFIDHVVFDGEPDLLDTEEVCLRCREAKHAAAFLYGVCRDCATP